MSDIKQRLSFLEDEILQLKNENRLIKPKVLNSAQSPISTIDGKEVINLTSNNYLCLSIHPKVKQASIDATENYGMGSAAVRTIIGTMSLHTQLEERLAEFKHTEAALLIQSGFASNVSVCQSLMSSTEDLLISDELNHASIIDGGKLSKAKKKIYPHCDIGAIEKILSSNEAKKARRRMLVTDGVFSMDGDIAPLCEILQLCEKYNTILMVDDAHASGVLGKQGRGTVSHFGLEGKVDIQIGTLSKAFSAVGGYVASTNEVKDYMTSITRPFLFSSSTPPSVIASCIAGLDVMYNEPQLMKKLWDNTKFFKEEMANLGFDIGNSQTPIVPIMVGDTKLAQQFSKLLFDDGVFALAIGFPTVALGKERLRTIITAGHSIAQLEKAISSFKKIGKKLNII